ncbi:uncharacterized protein LOC120513095 [Passer montanus]|uniref:uncharacterized protein LOC120513095 n=1 Tax=Passer montanus TaxID=9160 RepID=UPI001960A52B|nr:uncharacterized protein LOC120513095 [Passer montanus]
MSCQLSPCSALPGPPLPQGTLPVPLNAGGTPELSSPPLHPQQLQVWILGLSPQPCGAPGAWALWGALSILPKPCSAHPTVRITSPSDISCDWTPATLPFLWFGFLPHRSECVCRARHFPLCIPPQRRQDTWKESWNKSLASSRTHSTRNTQGRSPEKRTWRWPSSPWSVDLNPKLPPKLPGASSQLPCRSPQPTGCAQGPAVPAPCTSVTPTQTHRFQTKRCDSPRSSSCPHGPGVPLSPQSSQSTPGRAGSASRAKEWKWKHSPLKEHKFCSNSWEVTERTCSDVSWVCRGWPMALGCASLGEPHQAQPPAQASPAAEPLLIWHNLQFFWVWSGFLQPRAAPEATGSALSPAGTGQCPWLGDREGTLSP